MTKTTLLQRCGALLALLSLLACASSPRKDDSSADLGVRAAIVDPGVRAAIVDVRVGLHPGFTRVVLETDGPAGFRIDPSRKGEILVHLDASAAGRRVSAPGGVLQSIEVEPKDTAATVRLELHRPQLQVRHYVLGSPPRLILDLRNPMKPEPALRVPQVADVRIGVHESFTRLVIETDAPSRYQIEQGGDHEIAIHLQARAARQLISSPGPLLESVRFSRAILISGTGSRVGISSIGWRQWVCLPPLAPPSTGASTTRYRNRTPRCSRSAA